MAATYSSKNNYTHSTDDYTGGHQQCVEGVSDGFFGCIAFIEVSNELESYDDLSYSHTDEGRTRAKQRPAFFIIRREEIKLRKEEEG